jgi:hypothetical protein
MTNSNSLEPFGSHSRLAARAVDPAPSSAGRTVPAAVAAAEGPAGVAHGLALSCAAPIAAEGAVRVFIRDTSFLLTALYSRLRDRDHDAAFGLAALQQRVE